MSEIIYLRGIPSPKFRVQQRKQDLDQDLFVNLLANHPEHIARARAKRDAYVKDAKDQAKRSEKREKMLHLFYHVAIWSVVALLAVIAW